MSRFIKLESGHYVNTTIVLRIHVEKHADPKFWKLNAQLSKPEGGVEWAYLSGEFESQKDVEEAIKKLSNRE